MKKLLEGMDRDNLKEILMQAVEMMFTPKKEPLWDLVEVSTSKAGVFMKAIVLYTYVSREAALAQLADLVENNTDACLFYDVMPAEEEEEVDEDLGTGEGEEKPS